MKRRITIVIEAETSHPRNAYGADCDRADIIDSIDHGDLRPGQSTSIEIDGTGDVVVGQLVSVETKLVG